MTHNITNNENFFSHRQTKEHKSKDRKAGLKNTSCRKTNRLRLTSQLETENETFVQFHPI